MVSGFWWLVIYHFRLLFAFSSFLWLLLWLLLALSGFLWLPSLLVAFGISWWLWRFFFLDFREESSTKTNFLSEYKSFLLEASAVLYNRLFRMNWCVSLVPQQPWQNQAACYFNGFSLSAMAESNVMGTRLRSRSCRGSTLEQLNWSRQTSPKPSSQSSGMWMVRK